MKMVVVGKVALVAPLITAKLVAEGHPPRHFCSCTMTFVACSRIERHLMSPPRETGTSSARAVEGN
jgi:hypothetical protein